MVGQASGSRSLLHGDTMTKDFSKRLRAIEKARKQLSQKIGRIRFRDGRGMKMPLADIIPFFAGPEAQEVTRIDGGGQGQGQLLELLTGLIEHENDGA